MITKNDPRKNVINELLFKVYVWLDQRFKGVKSGSPIWKQDGTKCWIPYKYETNKWDIDRDDIGEPLPNDTYCYDPGTGAWEKE